MHTVGPSTFFSFVLVLSAAGIVVLVAICRVIVGEWIERARCRKWPTVPSVVDIVSVAYCEPDSSPILYFKASSYNAYYQATLTYVYQYPEQQMGDYSRRFGDKTEAQVSVLQEEDL